MKRILLLMFATVSGVILIGCIHTPEGQRGPITIGAVYNLTGVQSELDVPSAEGARAAVEEINNHGGLLNREVQLLLVDGESQPAVITRKMKELFSKAPSLVGVVGLSDTDMVLAAAPVAARHHRVFITSGATSPLLPAQVPDYLFLSCFGDNVQAAAGAEWASASLGADKALVLYNATSSYTRLLQGYFKTRFRELGGKISMTLPYDPQNLAKLQLPRQNFDLIYLAATPEEVLPILNRIRKAGLTAPVLGGDGLDIGSSWQRGKRLSNIYFTTHAYLGGNNVSHRITVFKMRLAAINPALTPDAFTALGFDAINLLADAIKKAGTTEPEAVRHALAGIKNFHGVTGDISFRDNSRIPKKSVTIIKVDHGRQQLVERLVPTSSPNP